MRLTSIRVAQEEAILARGQRDRLLARVVELESTICTVVNNLATAREGNPQDHSRSMVLAIKTLKEVL